MAQLAPHVAAAASQARAEHERQNDWAGVT